ncbi:MAG: hypothetical protein R3F62_22200 [Planctomycetota bacterium]
MGCADDAPPPPGAGVAPVVSEALAGRAPVAPVASSAALASLQRLKLDALPLDLGSAAALGAPAARELDDSSRAIAHETPEALIEDTLAALAAGDVLALARALRGPGGALTEDDAARAELRFLAPSAQQFWGRVAEAVREGNVDWVPGETPDEAWLVAHVGGAAGSYRIRLRREGEAWVLAS